MSETFSSSHSSGSGAPELSPLAGVLLDGFSEGLVVIGADGRVVYANHPARGMAAKAGVDLHARGPELHSRLVAMGGRGRALHVGELEVGVAIFLPVPVEPPDAVTLADQEKAAIVRMLDAYDWKLAKTAKHLGISRTTLWRRLKAYGLHHDGNP